MFQCKAELLTSATKMAGSAFAMVEARHQDMMVRIRFLEAEAATNAQRAKDAKATADKWAAEAASNAHRATEATATADKWAAAYADARERSTALVSTMFSHLWAARLAGRDLLAEKVRVLTELKFLAELGQDCSCRTGLQILTDEADWPSVEELLRDGHLEIGVDAIAAKQPVDLFIPVPVRCSSTAAKSRMAGVGMDPEGAEGRYIAGTQGIRQFITPAEAAKDVMGNILPPLPGCLPPASAAASKRVSSPQGRSTVSAGQLDIIKKAFKKAT
jgi:hypothetical protein